MSKKQWKLVTQDLPCTFSTKSNWSQDESDSTTRDVSEIRSVLPTKTSATRQISDLENIPQNGPFLLNFSNIPYEADENAIRHFFQAYEVVNVTKSEIKRGTGIIEFKDLNSLSGALGMAERTFISRPIRLTIGLPDDLNRIKSGRQQSGRYQNQQRNTPSTINEDSDNWRVKKSQPAPQPSTDNFAPRNDRSNWRDKPPTIRTEDKVLPENSENWRRVTNREPKTGSFNRRNPTVQDSTKSISFGEQRSEPKEDLIKETKKVSIFGDAKPVDTQSKDLEIEEKIAHQKKQVSDEPTNKTENSPGNNPWVPKKSIPQNSATVDKSDTTLEGRGSKAPSNWIKSNVGVNQPVKPPEPIKPEPAEPSKMEPQPATPPVNIWMERMKAKGIPPTTQVNRNNSASKPGFDKSLSQSQSLSTEKLDPNPIDHQQTSQIGSNNAQPSSQSNAVTTELKATQKPPVVISVNGPFLDPKSRTPHHSMSDNSSNKTPTAVPISKSSPSDSYKDPIDPRSLSKPLSSALSSSSELQQQSKPTNPPINACGKQSSWAKGPPKGLLEKTEINQ